MPHQMIFAEDYLDFDHAEAEAEVASAQPPQTETEMTKAEMIEAMANLLATAEMLTLDRIVWLAGLRTMKKDQLVSVFSLFLVSFEAGLGANKNGK